MLTKKQLKQIEEIIKNRFLSFTYEAIGERALTSEEIDILKNAGLIRSSVRNMIGDSYILGKVVALMKRESARGLTFNEVLELAGRVKMTGIEREAMNWASNHAGQYIKGLSDDMIRETTAEIARRSGSALRAVQDQVADSIKNRETVSELKTALFDIIDDSARDWRRVASTEMTNAVQNGIYSEIRSHHGSDQFVYKKPTPNACKHCKRVYLEDDGVTPKIFKLSELSDSNIGKKAMEWEPTVGCFPSDVLVDGKSIEDIMIGEMVTTHTGDLRPVIGKKTEKSSQLIVFNRGELTCTPNHHILIFRDGEYLWKQAGEIEKGDFLCRKKDMKESV